MILTEKRPFKYRLENVTHSQSDPAYLDLLDLTSEQRQRILLEVERHYRREEMFEREWRNHELGVTDKLMLADSTYRGERIPGTARYQEIIDYRQSLRDYNCLDQARPSRPSWFSG